MIPGGPISLSALADGLFFLLLLGITIHTVVLAFHWFTYGANKQTSMIALALYLGGAAFLFIVMSINMTKIM